MGHYDSCYNPDDVRKIKEANEKLQKDFPAIYYKSNMSDFIELVLEELEDIKKRINKLDKS